MRLRALALFDEVSALRSEHLRAVACAALGAFELLRSGPAHAGARRLLSQAMLLLEDKEVNESWPWPEARLSYANALLPEASLSAATVIGDANRASGALDQLRWLVERQTLDEHFSFTPVGGCDASTTTPMFASSPSRLGPWRAPA